MTQEYQLRDLGPIGAEIHNGNQGIIYALPQNPSLVFKRYIDTKKTDKITLSALIDWPAGLPRAEQVFLQDSTAWPNALVWEGEHLVGVTMPRAPERFTFRASDGKSRSTTLSIAIDEERTHIRQHIPVPNQTQRLWLAYHLCRLLALFERYGIIYLDLSSKNILWSLDPKPAVFLVDCDSAFPVWRQNSAASVRTGNWYDPWYRNPPSLEEIRGLFSLLFARLVFAKEYPNYQSHLILEPPDNPFAKSFQALVDVGYAPDFAQRPSMATWQAQIEKALGIAHDPFKKLLRYVPGATRVLQQTKQTYEELKNTVVVFKIKRILLGIPTFIEDNRAGIAFIGVVCLFIIAPFIMYEQQNQIDKKIHAGTLFESVWKNDISVQCTHNLEGLSIYASGEQNERILRITVSFNNPPVGERHYIIKSDVKYWWDVQYGAKTQGNKNYIDEVAIEEFLGKYQEAYLSGYLRCEFWFDPDGNLFALPSHITFND